jgi:hypothetical protein
MPEFHQQTEATAAVGSREKLSGGVMETCE